MKKRLLLLTLTLLGSALLLNYRSLTIYTTPEVVFQDSKKSIFKEMEFSSYWRCYQNTDVAPTPNKRFQLLNWNIHKGKDPNWQEDLKKFTKKKDFVLLQEATSGQQISDLLSQFENSLHIFAFQYQQQKSGILNLSHLDADRYCLNGSQEPLLRLPKLMSAMRFPFENGQSLLVINVHLINFDWTNHSYQKQLDGLKVLIQQHQGAVILAGDFNTWNEKRKAKLLELTNDLQLAEVQIIPDIRTTVFGYPLDYIFTRDIIVHSATSYTVKSSDHNPLELDFSLK
ncbi:endonuclease/exonuclease/phosphatase family protein [Mannheimia varigena]|uniref:endonuclease/exonuclease/phosphatase family protein n=1 Tax=Mannheimia varigena TaxID=85404 RepID=UPI000DBF044F|nr:endonuclease/exonuclease/phosphatase family protein [Mannheimia varigena]AWW34787.1 endonuclease/exonuclease/phosphatase family protein [Mannheimia varigena]